MASSTLSWSHCRQTLQQSIARFQRVRKRLTDQQRRDAEELIRALQSACDAKDQERASSLALRLESELDHLLPEPGWHRWIRSVGGLIIMLVALVVVRQMWFELYVIPTGSMRPTFKEQDRLVVSKTTFGINPPLGPGHLYWDPALLQAGTIIVFTTEGLPMQDHWDRFLWVLPVRRQLVKRCMGKGGMTLYFYGGQVWALDEQGNPTTWLRDPSWVKEIDYMPYIRPEGNMVGMKPGSSEVEIQQWNLPLARWQRMTNGSWQPQVHQGDRWMEEQPPSAETAYPAGGPRSYADFWGFRHHALCRLRTDSASLRQGPSGTRAVMEVQHTPQLKRSNQRTWGLSADLYLEYQHAAVPIGTAQWERLKQALYTARLVVQQGRLYQYGHEVDQHRPTAHTPSLPGIPDGIYEFSHGEAYEIGFGGLATKLAKDHPIYGDELFPTLFNLGVECNTLVGPEAGSNGLMPSRFIYFRHGDLYVMGHKIWGASDAELTTFLADQNSRMQVQESPQAPGAAPAIRPRDGTFIPFKDYGPPTAEQIKQFGYHVPAEQVIALGDNHAQSGDSRYFGPVPMNNLVGSPSVLLWPWSQDHRIGSLPQPPRPWCTLPNLLIGGIGIAGITIAEGWNIRKRRRRL
ncbi:MAG: S26 family signal peptidase [Chlamydiia bacterium]